MYGTITSKKNINLGVFWLFIMAWVLFGLNTNNADYKNYEYAYNCFVDGVANDYLETGFELIMRFCIILKFSYQMFLVFISAITLLIFTFAIKHLTTNRILTFALYLIYPFVFDVVQYRNFLGFAIVLYGIHFLFKKNGIWDIIVYLLFVLLATQFHSSMIIYTIFVLVKIRRTKLVFILSCLGFVGLIVVLKFQGLVLDFFTILHLEKYVRYEVEGTLSTFIQYSAVYFAMLALAVFKHLYVDRIPYFEKRCHMVSSETKMLKIIMLCMPLVPFIIMNGTSARFIRNTYIIFYAYICSSSNQFEFICLKGRIKYLSRVYRIDPNIYWHNPTLKNNIHQTFEIKKQWYGLLTLASAAIVVFVFSMQLTSGLYYEVVLIPVITCNLLW